MSTPEGEIQRSILDYLRLRGHFVFRLNNIPPTFIDRHGERQFRKLSPYALKGIPDIALIKDGKFYGIEVKIETGKLSPDQADFGRRCVAAGGEYLVARSLDDIFAAGL